MPAKRPLTIEQWRQAYATSHAAEQAFDRLWSGLGSTMSAPVMDSWNKLDSARGHLHQWIKDEFWDLFGRPIAELRYTASCHRISWFDDRKPRGNRPRPLERAEWVVLGDEVKAMRAAFMDVASILATAYPLARSSPWDRLADRLDRLKSKLDSECCRQHPRWPEFKRVFYGPAFSEMTEPMDGVDAARVALIRVDEVFTAVRPSSPLANLRRMIAERDRERGGKAPSPEAPATL